MDRIGFLEILTESFDDGSGYAQFLDAGRGFSVDIRTSR